jgi:hypothetical protein
LRRSFFKRAREIIDGGARPEVCVTIPKRREAQFRLDARAVIVAGALKRGRVGGVIAPVVVPSS